MSIKVPEDAKGYLMSPEEMEAMDTPQPYIRRVVQQHDSFRIIGPDEIVISPLESRLRNYPESQQYNATPAKKERPQWVKDAVLKMKKEKRNGKR